MLHRNPTTGKMGTCSAKSLESCPFDSGEHFPNKTYAEAYNDRINEIEAKNVFGNKRCFSGVSRENSDHTFILKEGMIEIDENTIVSYVNSDYNIVGYTRDNPNEEWERDNNIIRENLDRSCITDLRNAYFFGKALRVGANLEEDESLYTEKKVFADEEDEDYKYIPTEIDGLYECKFEGEVNNTNESDEYKRYLWMIREKDGGIRKKFIYESMRDIGYMRPYRIVTNEHGQKEKDFYFPHRRKDLKEEMELTLKNVEKKISNLPPGERETQERTLQDMIDRHESIELNKILSDYASKSKTRERVENEWFENGREYRLSEMSDDALMDLSDMIADHFEVERGEVFHEPTYRKERKPRIRRDGKSKN